MNLLPLLIVLLSAATAYGYHILCIFGIPSKSHDRLGNGIVSALLNGGHEVTWVTPFPETKKPTKGLTIIDASSTLVITQGIDMNRNANASLAFVRAFAKNISIFTANVPGLRDVITKKQYDAVMTETFFTDVDAGYAAIQQVPWIVLSGVVLNPLLESRIDDPRSISTLPLMFNDYPIPMGFVQRVINMAMYTAMAVDDWLYASQEKGLYESTFSPLAAARGVPLPPFEQAKYNISILLVNSHTSFAPAQSLPPNVVEIGGYHIDEDIPPLPKDLQEILDSSPQGVVYFSMGSVLKSSAFPEKTRKELLQVLGGLKQTVLWKFEETLTGLPKNVHVRPWMPQPSILAHPNVKVFITHGGLLSTLESLRCGVPLLAIPVFGDQPSNAARAVRFGYARRVQYSFDMAPEMGVELKKMLTDDSYYKKAKELSRLFNSRPVKPAHLISYYVNLAIESKGALHLRSKTYLYAWYERWMADVLVVMLAALCVIYFAAKKLIKSIANKCSGNKQYKPKKNKEKRN